MATLLLYPLFYGVEVFLASAFATQIAVSVAAVIVSTVTFYICRHQVNLWRENNEDNVLTAILYSFRNEGDANARARIRVPRPFDEYASGDTDRSSSENEVFDVNLLGHSSLLRHDHRKSRSHLRSEPTSERSGRHDRRTGETPAGLGGRSYSLPGPHSDRPRSRRPKLPEALHRSHWVAKPQQSASNVRKGIVIPSESEIEDFLPFKRRRERSRERGSRRTTLTSSSSSLSNSSAESEDVLVACKSSDVPTATSASTAKETQLPKETTTKLHRRCVPSIRVESIEENTYQSDSSTQQECAPSKTDIQLEIKETPGESSPSLSEKTLFIIPSNEKDIATVASISVPRLTATCTSTVTVQVTPSDDNQTDRSKRRGSPPVILAAIACEDDSGDQHVDEIVLPYRRPVRNISTPQVTHEEPPRVTEVFPSEGKPSVISSEEIHLARQGSLGVPPVFVGEVSFPGPQDNRPPPPPYSVAIKDVTPRQKFEETFVSSKLNVPHIIPGEVSFPPLADPSEELARLEQIEKNRESVLAIRRLGTQKVRPKSLNIPIVVTTPDDEEGDTKFQEGHGVKRKHSSILKRSNSTDRPSRKKSVTFSPDVPPYDDTKRVSRRGGRVCRRQKAIRHHSSDSPDPTIPHTQFDFSHFIGVRYGDKPPPSYEEFMSMYTPSKWSEGDPSDGHTFSKAPVSGEATKGTIVFERSWPCPFSQIPSQPTQSEPIKSKESLSTPDQDSAKKSAKDRFLEACGPKAVISVLCTQESISEPDGLRVPDQDSGIHSSSNVPSSRTEDTDQAPDVTYTATRPLSDQGAAKTRFFGSKEDELLTSKLFVQAVRYSIDSDSLEAEKSSVPNSPTLVEEEERLEIIETDDDTAKIRFLISCQDEDQEEHRVPDGQADDEASAATDTDLVRRKKKLPETEKGNGAKEHKADIESDDTDDDQAKMYSISSRGSDRYRCYLEDSTEDIGFFDSDSSENDSTEEHKDGAKCSESSKPSEPPSEKSSAVVMKVPVPAPSPAEKIKKHAMDTSTMTKPSIKYTNVWTASTGSPGYQSETAIVLDNGSEVLKAGMAGSYLPSITIPTVIGRRKSESSADVARGKTKWALIGHEVMGSRHGAMSFDYPIEDGIVDNWNDLEAIWEYVMSHELSLTPGEHPILLSEIASAPREQREKCLEVMFEKLNAPALYVANQASLSLYANADTSGLVLSSGSGITEVVPVLDGNTLKHAVTTLDIAGKEVTRQLGRLLQMEKGYSFSSSSDRETLRNMKESLAYVCPDYETEMLRVKHTSPSEYRLPDGSPLSVGPTDLFRCTEALFQPEIAGLLNQSGMANLITESLQRCDSEFLCSSEPSILLTGGNTKIKGFVDRLRSELHRTKVDRKITAPEERIYSTWVGGSILASHSSFSERWISANDYSEHGANIVNRRSSLF